MNEHTTKKEKKNLNRHQCYSTFWFSDPITFIVTLIHPLKAEENRRMSYT